MLKFVTIKIILTMKRIVVRRIMNIPIVIGFYIDNNSALSKLVPIAFDTDYKIPKDIIIKLSGSWSPFTIM